MCAKDRKVWSRDLERERKPATLNALINWMSTEMKSRCEQLPRLGVVYQHDGKLIKSMTQSRKKGRTDTSVGCARTQITGRTNAKNLLR